MPVFGRIEPDCITDARESAMNKRDFVRTVGGAAVGMFFGPELLAQMAATPAAALAEDEKFWAAVRAKFKLTRDYINLENGYFCFQPEEVLESFMGHVRAVNLEA